jgi:hypothetical protein
MLEARQLMNHLFPMETLPLLLGLLLLLQWLTISLCLLLRMAAEDWHDCCASLQLLPALSRLPMAGP